MKSRSSLSGQLLELADWIEIRATDGSLAARLRRSAEAKAIRLLATSPFESSLVQEAVAGDAERALQRARGAVPFLVRELFAARVTTSSDLARLVRQAGVVTIQDLALAIDSGRLTRTFGTERAAKLAAWLESAEPPVITLGRAADVADAIVADITEAAPMVTAAEPAGDIRRCASFVSQVVIAARADRPEQAVDAIARIESEVNVLHRSARRLIFNYRQTEVDVRIAAPDEHGTVLFTATGARAHYRAVLAARGRIEIHAREDQVYASAGLPWIAPELREGEGEIEAAAEGRLPQLIELQDIRGDLHMHSTYSDGRDSVETMVRTCHELGYEYIAITDHSHGAGASRTLAVQEIPRQREEITRLREEYPGMTILHGVEVDILPNGRLDFEDSVLEGFDIVLASLHDDAGHDGTRLTNRSLAALRHPLVNVISHPWNRIVGRREGYPLDFEAIYAAAAETGTALEIDGAPGHLDLDGEHARAAARAGVTLVIDSDCHRAALLRRQMELGVGTARRGWIEPRHVLTTRNIQEVLSFIRAKRQGRSGPGLYPGQGTGV